MPRRPDFSPDQEAVVRQFITGCEMYHIPIMPEYYHMLLTRMGYKVAPNGARVHLDVELKYEFGNPDVFEDTYDKDAQESTANELANNTYTTDPSTSESSPSDTMGRLLRKEV